MKKPLIGIVLDHEPPGGYSEFPWYALRENYFQAVRAAGGVPLGLSYGAEDVETYLSLIQGLLIPGGFFDIDPTHYGHTDKGLCHGAKDNRTRFEMCLLRKAIEKKTPFLGICAGMQLLNVLRGGTLHQDIKAELPHALTHEQKTIRSEPSHPLHLREGTYLHRMAGVTETEVNSTHHQAIQNVGTNLVINAHAPDGVIEGIEDPTLPFCLGVQWHPEYTTTDLDRVVFKHFIEAATHHGS